jgi:hypothetical protein
LAGVGPVLVVRSFPMGRLALAIFFTSKETFYRLGTLITQDLVVASKPTFIISVGKGRKLTVAGNLRYQVCDETKCFLPAVIPVSWEIQVAPLDLEPAPTAVQHK